MEICFLPAGDENTASSRLRVYTLISALNGSGISATAGYDASARFFIFQKKLTSESIDLAIRLRSQGKVVIYDVDDMPPELDYWAPDPLVREMLQIAMLITTDTRGRKDYLERTYDIAESVEVIPDPIDYFPAGWHAPATIAEFPIRVLWFGSVSNVGLFENYAHKLRGIPGIQLVAATSHEVIGTYSALYPFVEFQPWSLKQFPDILRRCHLTLLMHDGTEIDRQKSNNKMICSINLGVPAIVSNTPDYAETARKCGVDFAIFNDLNDVERCISTLSSKASRESYLTIAQEKVWQDYAPAVIARQLHSCLYSRFQNSFQSHSLEKMAIKLNLGSGGAPVSGYINVDVAPERAGVIPDVVCDIRDLKIFDSNYADEILSIHVIEHFWRWEVVDILKEWVRVLKPGGKLILECPNLVTACEELLKNPNVSSGPGPEGQRSMWCLYGDPSHRDPLMCHRWLYTPVSLAQVMLEAGLTDFKREPAEYKLRDPRDMRITGIKPYSH